MMIETGVEVIAVLASLCGATMIALEAILGKRGIEAGGSPFLASLMVAIVSTIVFWSIVLLMTDARYIVTRTLVGIFIFFLAGAVSSGIGVLAIYQGVDRVGASINTAVVNSRPLFVTVLGYLLLSETLEAITIAGIVILAFGLVLIGLSRGGDIRGWEPVELIFPLGAASAFAVGNVIRRYGLTQTDIPLVEGIAINAVGGLVVLAGYVCVTRREEILAAPRRSYGWFTLTGLSTSGALLSMFFALERERVAIVDSILATAPLLTLVLTALFLRDVERITQRVVVGAALVVVGVIFIVVL